MGVNEIDLNQQGDHPSGIPQDKIDNIMSGICNTGAVKLNNHKKKLRQRFDLIKKLGQGTYGKVQLGINKDTGQEVAIKTIKKCKIEAEADLIRIRREVQIMSSVQHPNIIHIYEVFENREKMVLVMEFAAGGELYDYLSERKVLAEEEARRIFRQVATAVYYCHKHKICHRDLKLENILLDENGNAKIADFGLSNVFDDAKLLATFCGSPLYASPEIVKGTPYLGPEVDCWSLGVLLYTLVYGSMPFDGSNFKKLVKQISQGDYYEPKKPSRASPLIREMLTVCPQRRATIEQICNHWWVNEGYDESCLNLAEDLANQTPVRLDVLLSLSPASITADQLVVPCDMSKANERVMRSHSVGSIQNIANTEAERKILDMVAAGGEAAIMPSPTHTITPIQSPVQAKRKIEGTLSSETVTKTKKQEEQEQTAEDQKMLSTSVTDILNNTAAIQNEKSFEETVIPAMPIEQMSSEPMETISRQKTLTRLDSVKECTEENEEINPAKVIKNFVNKHKTADLVAAINNASIPNENEEIFKKSPTKYIRKNSLPDQSLFNRFNTERRNSRILEQAERFQNMGNVNQEKNKKIVIPGVSVSSFKKEFERRASLTNAPIEEKLLEKKPFEKVVKQISMDENKINSSESKPLKQTSVINTSLDEARKSMKNSIALLNQAKNESSKEVDQLCQKTQNVVVSDEDIKREMKLKAAREIIGNAIQPGVRKPPVPFGSNGRSISNSILSPTALENRSGLRWPSEFTTNDLFNSNFRNKDTQDVHQEPVVKTSKAEITLKSATLPRRKTAKAEIQLEMQPKIEETPMRFSTEFQHHLPDLRSAPVRESPYSPPIIAAQNSRANSLGPTGDKKEHFIPIQRPSTYKPGTFALRSGLSRQSTNESDTETNLSPSQTSSSGGISQPIKKSPREFIIPIAVEGGGFITPKPENIESSESTRNSSSTFSRFGKNRNMGTLFSDSDKNSAFNKSRPLIEDREPPFAFHRLRSSRPTRTFSQENEESSGEEDDDDGFEILTAENLFSTLLQRVRALTNRLHVNDNNKFPNSSRLLQNMTQTQNDFWNQDPFGSSHSSYSYKSERFETNHISLSENVRSPWRHSLSRDLGTDMDSFLNRTGATLPRGAKSGDKKKLDNHNHKKSLAKKNKSEKLDLADLDLSRLCLSKNDLETLSYITPDLPKSFQEQLLAKLPSPQAKKLSRTLSMQNYSENSEKEKTPKNLIESDNVTCSNCPVCMDSSEKSKETLKTFLGKETCSECLESNSRGNTTRLRDKAFDKRSKSVCLTYCSDVNNDKYKYYSPYLTENDSKKQVKQRPEASLGICKDNTSDKSSPANVKSKGNNSNVPLIKIDKTAKETTNKLGLPKLIVNEVGKLPKIENFNKDDRSRKKTSSVTNRRNKSLERYSTTTDKESLKVNRRSFSRSREKSLEYVEKDELVKQILDALRLLSIRNNEANNDLQKNETEIKSKIDDSNISNSNISKKVKKSTEVRKNSLSSTQISDDSKNSTKVKSKLKRPKSYPNKQIEETIQNPIQKDDNVATVITTVTTNLSASKSGTLSKIPTVTSLKEDSSIIVDKIENSNKSKATLKKNRVSSKSLAKANIESNLIEEKPKPTSKGLLYAIGQKFEKLRENSKSKINKKDETLKKDEIIHGSVMKNNSLNKISSKKDIPEKVVDDDKTKNSKLNGKKSRIEDVVKMLREKSVLRTSPNSESNLLKKAVSVEEIPNIATSSSVVSGDKYGVNKVLNLFKRCEKDEKPKLNLNASETSINKTVDDVSKKKSKSSCAVFLNHLKTDDKIVNSRSKLDNFNDCPDCRNEEKLMLNATLGRLKNNKEDYISKARRSNLHLDLKNYEDKKQKRSRDNYLDKYIGNCEINRNYSSSVFSRSSSRNNFDDCTSLCTSPTEDPELCFDNYSIYSDDTNMARPKYTSEISSPTNLEYQNESMIDRIRRRSYYTRFNEKKPKRQSSLLGPASRDYYRDVSARHNRMKSPERIYSFNEVSKFNNGTISSTLLDSSRNLNSYTIDSKPPRYNKPLTEDYYKQRSRIPPTKLTNLDYTPTSYDTPSSYSTYSSSNSKIHALSSYPVVGSSSSANKYATVGRKVGSSYSYEPRRNSLVNPIKTYRYSSAFDFLKKEKPMEPPRTVLQNRSTSVPKSSTSSPPTI